MKKKVIIYRLCTYTNYVQIIKYYNNTQVQKYIRGEILYCIIIPVEHGAVERGLVERPLTELLLDNHSKHRTFFLELTVS